MSRDDPFLGHLPDVECAANPWTALAATRRGGHLAFLQGLWPLGASWADAAVTDWLGAALEVWRARGGWADMQGDAQAPLLHGYASAGQPEHASVLADSAAAIQAAAASANCSGAMPQLHPALPLLVHAQCSCCPTADPVGKARKVEQVARVTAAPLKLMESAAAQVEHAMHQQPAPLSKL